METKWLSNSVHDKAFSLMVPYYEIFKTLFDPAVQLFQGRRLEKKLQREVNYRLYPLEDWRKRRTARDSFVMEVLRQPRIPLLGDPNALRWSDQQLLEGGYLKTAEEFV